MRGTQYVWGQFTHQISQDRRADGQRRSDETVCDGQRISITMRCVSTYRRMSDGRLWGQGACFKSEEELDQALEMGDATAGLVSESEDEERIMRQAFHKENKDPEFDWASVYSKGFNVVNFRTLNEGDNKTVECPEAKTSKIHGSCAIATNIEGCGAEDDVVNREPPPPQVTSVA